MIGKQPKNASDSNSELTCQIVVCKKLGQEINFMRSKKNEVYERKIFFKNFSLSCLAFNVLHALIDIL